MNYKFDSLSLRLETCTICILLIYTCSILKITHSTSEMIVLNTMAIIYIHEVFRPTDPGENVLKVVIILDCQIIVPLIN